MWNRKVEYTRIKLYKYIIILKKSRNVNQDEIALCNVNVMKYN